MGVYWKDLGEAMEISYDKLPSSSSSWRDGFHWLEELEAWSLAYETRHMVTADTNATLARTTFDIALFNLLASLKPYGLSMIPSLLEPRLREAMKLSEPPSEYASILGMFVELRKAILRNFCLPPQFLNEEWFTEQNPQTGRANFCQYTAHPWYIKPSYSTRWGPKALLLRLIGGMIPGEKKYYPRGYRIHELGPSELVGKGDAGMKKTRE